ncbi:MAG: HAMP domain-containing sensor histidine kinase [Bacillota bacterium]|nr:HAMP domain-containing sensor histidine kinase [Bacillota bacterium]
MDTKSKNNHNLSLLIAVILVLCASVGFSALYPMFGKRAAEYAGNVLSSESFLTELYWGNRVLYKELAEKVQGESLRYCDLFLQKVEYMDEGGVDYADGGEMESLNSDEEGWSEAVCTDMDELMESYEVHMLEGIARALDYCAVDNATGKRIGNTGNEIERLGTDQADSGLTDMYPYYIKMSFDDAGYLENVWVKGENSEELLRNVQSVMKRKKLEQAFFNETYLEGWHDGDAFYWQNDDGRKAQVKIENGLKGMTVCYALTQIQKEALSSVNGSSYLDSSYRYMEEQAYYVIGTNTVMEWFMVVLGIIAFLLPRWKRYRAHKWIGTKVHLELVLLMMLFWISLMSELTLRMVYCTNAGYFRGLIEDLTTRMTSGGADVISYLVNLLFIIVVFGVWYYLVTTLGEIHELGPGEFIRERSLLWKYLSRVCRFGKKKICAFKDEILHVDLGEKSNKVIFKLVALNFVVLAAVCMMWMFGWAALVIYSIILYIALKKYVQRIQEQYRSLLTATKSIAKGNLQTEFDGDWGVFESYKQELSEIQSGFSKAVEEEVKSQRMKTELITNVSHDLKTPLTAITTYIELLKDESITKEQQKEYLAVLEKKAFRLKTLIEDLFEVSKASSGNVTLHPADVDICNLMRQVYLEYEDKAEDANLIFRFRMPEEKVILRLDSQKTYRIFENLYTNIIKYAMPGTRVYVNAEKTGEGISIELKNMSKAELSVTPESLTERFVRGDSSRNTEGSGLGLAIAKSFVELQGGKLNIEIDGDLFKVIICW